MKQLLKYMDLAYPFDLTIETSKEHGEITIKLYDLTMGKLRVIDSTITLIQVHSSEIDLIESNIELIKNKLVS